jgi:CheY-like chemotaxis protein
MILMTRIFFMLALADLHHLNAQCITADDGVDALPKLNLNRDFTPDFISNDVNMPRMNGRTCFTGIKKIPRLSQVLLVASSTSSAQKNISETLAHGASHYVSKPASIKTVSTLLPPVFAKHNS